ncbi:MAG: HAD family hydrolase [Rhodobacteraceae bacterium]|nr:MAG: HAD family hydrolase [Paracoccaceae bacterium]
MFDLVIFDCDGVLIDSEVISARMLIAELAAYGVEIDTAYVAEHFLGRSYPTVLRTIRDAFQVALPDGFETGYRARLIDGFRAALVPVPGVREVVERLAVPYALATSSSPPRLRESLEIAGLNDLFEGCATTASEVVHGKPAPDLFLRVAEKFSVEPSRCLVIEDSLAGVQAGLAAGMTVWRFTGGSHLAGLDLALPADATPHRVFASFGEFFHAAPQLLNKDPKHAA